ncbi:MAG: hypothetical protein ABI194_03115 [Gemmatimonadaceae bacterium]
MEKRQLTANDLRRLAEAVDGVRDETAYVVWGNTGPEVRTQRPASDEVIFECMTRNAVPDRARIGAITLQPPVIGSDGKPLPDFARRFDALFWSEAAVEKFMLPYYAGFSSPGQIDRMRKAFNQKLVVAGAHMPESTSCFLVSDGSGALSTLTLEELEAKR